MASALGILVHWVIDPASGQIEDLDTGRLEDTARRALAPEVDRNADLTVSLTGDDEIRQLNAQYRGLDEVTDVLSFPQQEGDVPFVVAPDGILHLGDIIISVPQAARQAPEFGRSLAQELALLVAHGALHLVGYDHATLEEEGEMRARERAALEEQGA
jgi:probable rRNA maturation factor